MNIISLFFCGSTHHSAFAASVNGTATATIVTPIAITATQNLAFGKAGVSGAGTIVMSTAGVRTATGGVTLVSTGSTHTRATFQVTGAASTTYSITLPGAAATLTNGTGGTMTVNAFTSNPSGTGTLSAAGAQTINVGGTLNITAAQAPGNYTGTFSMTVVYN